MSKHWIHEIWGFVFVVNFISNMRAEVKGWGGFPWTSETFYFLHSDAFTLGMGLPLEWRTCTTFKISWFSVFNQSQIEQMKCFRLNRNFCNCIPYADYKRRRQVHSIFLEIVFLLTSSWWLENKQVLRSCRLFQLWYTRVLSMHLHGDTCTAPVTPESYLMLCVNCSLLSTCSLTSKTCFIIPSF